MLFIVFQSVTVLYLAFPKSFNLHRWNAIGFPTRHGQSLQGVAVALAMVKVLSMVGQLVLSDLEPCNGRWSHNEEHRNDLATWIRLTISQKMPHECFPVATGVH